MLKRMKNLFVIKGYFTLTVAMLLVGIGLSVTFPYLSLYCTEKIHMTPGSFGAFMAISSLSGVVVNSIIAKRSDNGLNRKALILFAMTSSALGYASYLLFKNYIILLLTVSIFNGFGAASMPQIYASAQEAADESKTDDKTFAMSTLRSLFSLGFFIGPLIGTIILSALGYHGLFLSTSAMFLITATIIFIFLKTKKVVHSSAKSTEAKGAINIKQIIKPLIAFSLLIAVNAINGIITPLFIVNNLHDTHAAVGFVVSISAGLEIPIMIFLGSLGKKVSNHTLMIYGAIITIAYYLILGFSTSSIVVLVAQLLQATSVAILFGNGLSYFTDLIPNSPGLSTTYYANGSTLGRLLGTLGGGFIAQILGFRNVFFVCIAIVIISMILLISVQDKASDVVIE